MKLGQYRTSDAAVLIKCRIANYWPETGDFSVVPIDIAHEPNAQGFHARLLSPLPYDPKGGGITSVPTEPKDTGCWCIKIGAREYYIIGFFQLQSTAVYGSTHKNAKLEPGETYIGHNTGSHWRITKHGMFSFFTNMYAQVHMDPISQALLANFKNITINTYGGFVKWLHNLIKGTTTIFGEIHKNFDTSAVKGTLPTEKIKFQAGTLKADTHILEVDTKQIPTSQTEYNVVTNLKYGKQKTNKRIFEWTVKDKQEEKEINYAITIDNAGIVHFSQTRDLKDNVKSFDLALNAAAGTAVYTQNDAAKKKTIKTTLDVTGEMMVDTQVTSGDNLVQLTINPDGDTTIRVKPPGGKLFLGGTGKEQQLVTKSFVEQVYKSHIHGNGNQGAPTTAPMTPPVIPLDLDSSSNHYTFTVKAE
jgi:hypothetical protein